MTERMETVTGPPIERGRRNSTRIHYKVIHYGAKQASRGVRRRCWRSDEHCVNSTRDGVMTQPHDDDDCSLLLLLLGWWQWWWWWRQRMMRRWNTIVSKLSASFSISLLHYIRFCVRRSVRPPVCVPKQSLEDLVRSFATLLLTLDLCIIAFTSVVTTLFAEVDPYLYSSYKMYTASCNPQHNLRRLAEWFVAKTIFYLVRNCALIVKKFVKTDCCKYLGLLIDFDLKMKWQNHINYIYNTLVKFVSIFFTEFEQNYF